MAETWFSSKLKKMTTALLVLLAVSFILPVPLFVENAYAQTKPKKPNQKTGQKTGQNQSADDPNDAKPGEAKKTDETAATDEPAKPQILSLPPAYESQLMRLAELLGSLHYLRELCGANEGQTWRDEMQSLIVAEEPTEQRKALLIANFNRGFRSFREIYRECTEPASQAANQYLQQAVRISSEIPNRYGN